MEHRIERTRYDVVMISTNQNQIAAKTRPKAGVRRFDFDEEVSWTFPHYIQSEAAVPHYVVCLGEMILCIA